MKNPEFEAQIAEYLKNNLSIQLWADNRLVGGVGGYNEKTVTAQLYLKVGDEEIMISEHSTDIDV